MNGFFTSASQFVTKAVAKDYKWVTQQLNDSTLGNQQLATAPAYRAACQGKLVYTVWLTRPFDGPLARQMVVETGAQGILLEGEIPSEWKNPATGQVEPKPDAVDWPDVIFHLQDLDIAKGVVTNFAPFVHWDGQLWPDKAKPLIDAGYACVTECFISESPNATPARTAFTAHQLGWPRAQPMVEGWNLPAYGDLSAYVNVSHWDAGNVL